MHNFGASKCIFWKCFFSFLFFSPFFIICSIYIFSAFFRTRERIGRPKVNFDFKRRHFLFCQVTLDHSHSVSGSLMQHRCCQQEIPDVPDCPAAVAHFWSVQYFKKHPRLQLLSQAGMQVQIQSKTEVSNSYRCVILLSKLVHSLSSWDCLQSERFFSFKILISNTISFIRHSDWKKVHQDGEGNPSWACCADGMLTWSAEKN